MVGKRLFKISDTLLKIEKMDGTMNNTNKKEVEGATEKGKINS